jgi:hypothetical protein
MILSIPILIISIYLLIFFFFFLLPLFFNIVLLLIIHFIGWLQFIFRFAFFLEFYILEALF